MNKYGKLLFVLICFITKYIIFTIFPELSEKLDNTVEFSTPVSSFKSLKEGWYLIKHGFPLYYKNNGGIINQPPLLIFLLKPFEQQINAVYCLVDSLSMYFFMELISTFVELNPDSMDKSSIRQMAILYLINPLIFLSCISKSTVTFVHLFLLISLYAAINKSFVLSGISIAVSGYIDVYSLYLIVPLVSFTYLTTTAKKSISFITSTLTTLSLLIYTSYKLCDEQWWFLYNSYYVNLTFDKIFPNIGLWWYFFIEMFQFFRPFFKFVFNLFVASFILPFTIRFLSPRRKIGTKKSNDNLQLNLKFYCFVVSMGWIILTKSYPTFGETGFFLQFIIFFKPIKSYFYYTNVSILLFLHSIILAPIFYYLWICLGSGNSNFFYAISLVYGVAMGSVILDMVWAMLRIEYDEGKPNTDLKLVQI